MQAAPGNGAKAPGVGGPLAPDCSSSQDSGTHRPKSPETKPNLRTLLWLSTEARVSFLPGRQGGYRTLSALETLVWEPNGLDDLAQDFP